VRKLKLIREAAGMRREELAHLTGVSYDTIRSIENNGTDPRVSTALKIARALKVTVEELADGKK
jgi:DNA-binding XRE family transcriptional regulator